VISIARGRTSLKPSESKALIQRPDQYLASQAKTLDARLNGVTLPEGTEEVIASGAARRLIRDKILGLFKVGEVISALLSWNENIDKDIKEAKRDHLLALYFHQNEQSVTAISDLKSFLSSGQGNTLFNKIIRILDDSAPDEQLVAHLSAALKHIVDSDFRSLFEDHKYALSQIEQISPQALAILADQSSWPEMNLGSYQANGTKVQSDWLNEFATVYAQSKGIADSAMQSRVGYSINELTSRRIIEAHLVRQSVARCTVTDIGALLVPYLKS
jgi:hypothetical protein